MLQTFPTQIINYLFPVPKFTLCNLKHTETIFPSEGMKGLQGVEVDFQLAFFLHAWWLVHTAVISEVLQLLLHGTHGLLRNTVLQPWDRPTDPLQQLQQKEIGERGVGQHREGQLATMRGWKNVNTTHKRKFLQSHLEH